MATATQIKDSILHDTKQVLGLEFDDDSFDLDVTLHINSVFMTLSQIGVGPRGGYQITNADNKWGEFIGDDLNLNSVKSYVYLRLRLLFDPPTNSFLVESFQKQLNELEWRLSVQTDQTTI